MKNSLYTLCYAGLLGTVCALLLTFASSFTAPYRRANAEAEEIRNIMTALKVPLESNISSKRLVEIFNANIHEQSHGEQTIYVYSPAEAQGKSDAIAVRFSGSGLWGPIKGFLALEPDMKTIRGVTFYEQEETPGLGGEIASSWFLEQFAGKSIMDESGKGGIKISRGHEQKALNEVDAITGATMTCEKVESMLNTVIENIVKEKDRNEQ